MKSRDLTGQRFGLLIAIRPVGRHPKSGRVLWKCRCDCGNETVVSSSNLVGAHTKSCGCLHARPPANRLDLAGQRFGRLVAIERSNTTVRNGKVRWLCRCDCGGTSSVLVGNLRSGHTQSCGCFHREVTASRATHGGTRKGNRHRLYSRWCAMRERCTRADHPDFYLYGGIGVRVCERWEDFRNFVEDMGMPPGPGYSLDRYPNPAGNYEPGNVRWATAKQQRHNRRVG